MFDIGIWEFLVIGVLALLVFGPDKLPKAAADAGRLLRQLRAGAAAARSELTAAAGLEEGGELQGVLSDLRDLDPRRIVNDVIEPAVGDGPEPEPRTPPKRPDPGTAPGTTSGPAQAAKPESQADPDWT